MEDLGIDPSTYITSEEITATAGKNIIVLSLESLERGYLEPPLDNLTPNLRAFAKENTLINMEPSNGSGWTSASMYTVLTGLPSFFKSTSNQIFQNSIAYKGSNLGDVLKTAGYSRTYLMAKKDFSGMEEVLNTFHFNIKSGSDFGISYEKTEWGVPDKELFEEAKKEITLQSKKNKPFAIFLSTISGHFPNGVYDKRMEAVLPKQETNLEFMTSAVDLYVGQLIQFLKDEDLLKNTVVYIFPDHLLMGNESDVLKKFKNQRGLYVISNADTKELTKKLYEPISQIDLPRIILNGAGIKTNATFLTDFIKDKNKVDYLRINQKNLLALNEGFLRKVQYSDGFKLAIKNGGDLELNSKIEGFKTLIPNIKKNTLYAIEFHKDMRYISTNVIEHNEESGFSTDKYYDDELKDAFKGRENPVLTFSVIGDSIFGSFQEGSLIGVARAGDKEISFSKSDIEIFKQWKTTHSDKIIGDDKVFLRSTGYDFIPVSGNSAIYTGFKKYIVSRGLNLLYIENNKYIVKNFDTYESPEDAEAFMETLKMILQNKNDFAIVADDTAEKQLTPYLEELSNLGLELLSKLKFREAYIGYSKDGEVFEQKDERSITVQFKLTKLPPDPEIDKIKKETSRFIAHAGGGIDGDTYTNSLEALNYSYNKGFRRFEMDISETSDNIYAAAHDWNQWAEKTGYKGKLPPTHKIFLETPIKEYTPMDIDQINKWFKNHPDAILVTDKVNNPKEFSSKFIDKKRLIMELFSEDAVKEASEIGILAPMPSQTVIDGWYGKELEKLNEYGIKYIAVSRRIIADQLPLLKKLYDAGIKTYVYNINGDAGRDEMFVINNEMDYIYGLYADKWDFGK